MSETQVDHSTCGASGCAMLATRSSSTNGEGLWVCFIHGSTEPDDWFHVTAELTRLAWLVKVVRALRANADLPADLQHGFVLAQRGDLKQSERETRTQWMIRLENVLAQSCKASVTQ